MAPTTVTSICLVLFALLVLGLTAYGYYLILWAGASIRDREPDAHDIEAAVLELRQRIEEYERRQ